MKKFIICECPSCEGTGLYSGFAEPTGTAVICLQCEGQGWRKIEYKEFTGRKHRKGIKQIYHSCGTFIATGIGPKKETMMTYQQFEEKYPSKKPRKSHV